MILKTRGGNREVRDDLGAKIHASDGRMSSSGVLVKNRDVDGIAAAKEAIRIAAEGVALLELGVWRGHDLDRRRVRSTWQARLFDGATAGEGPSWFDLKEWIEASLTGRRNAFLLPLFSTNGQVAGLEFLHPDDVEARWNHARREPEYRYLTGDGPDRWSEWLDRTKIVHFRVGHASPGAPIAPSPVQQHKDELGALLARIRYESKLYEDGVLQSIAVMLDKDVTPEAAREFKEIFQEENGGIDNRAKVRVFGGGTSVETIGLSLADAQYIEAMQLGIDTIGRLYGVTASLLGGGSQATRPISPEHESIRWTHYGLEPRLERIASTFNAHPLFFGSGSRDYLAFTGRRGVVDTATESRALVDEVNAGILLPDEARARLGLPPLPDGLGQIPQITPVGGAPNPNASTPAPPDAGADDTEGDPSA